MLSRRDVIAAYHEKVTELQQVDEESHGAADVDGRSRETFRGRVGLHDSTLP